jgi:hypothetical protein
VLEVSHPPYSPDLAPAAFCLFPKVQNALKGRKFQGVEVIKKNATAELNLVSLDAFGDCFVKL